MSSGNSDGLLEIDVLDWSDDFEMEFPPVEFSTSSRRSNLF